ncbi:flagellar hook-associated protein FlgL [Sporolactobacillus sp. CPB3-1]|uniref:Flagellar hook-associated protein FlgL n=1 Tax=Sporolactobacillus mangiferae TaxID=2940498 RepID=A0ABT0MCR3_9BACL|nr:flagellar hook-associated protein FlgL [Sporolactobacillus mangiferae]MCL1632652.1 flagellar hook-associated protein FlgL [Sporolactobacillus mangiferae]
MRVTQGMMSNNILQDISNGYSKISDYQNQLSTGKKISRPSQDPIVASMGVAYRTDVSHVEQYKRNVTSATKWLDSSDDALQQANDVLTKIRELTNEASNGTQTADERKAIATEVDQLTQQLVTLGNTKVGNQYIFSGSNSDQPLLTEEADGTITANAEALANPDYSVAVNDGVQMTINVDPNTVFTEGLFNDLNNLKSDLESGTADESQISGYLDTIDTHLTEIINAQADLGAKTNRVELISSRLDQQKTVATKVMSSNEDADYAETLVNLNQQQNVFNASLSVGARIIQTSLVDFLQ